MSHTHQTTEDPTQALPTRWVMYRLSALGDVTLTTGVLDYWHAKRGWRFVVVTRDNNAPVFEGHPAVDQIITLKAEELKLPHLYHRFRELAANFADYGLLDLHNTQRSFLLRMLWQGVVRHYKKYELKRYVYLLSGKRCFERDLLLWNVPQRYTFACETTPPSRAEILPRIWLREDEEQQAAALLTQRLGAQAAQKKSAPVALHPYSTHINKAWIAASWQALIHLLDAHAIPWIVLGRGTPLPNIPAERDLTNQTSLRETCAVLRHCRALISGDSGPMHLATAVRTPVIALFGPTTAAWGFFPEGVHDHVLEATAVPCRPCSLHGQKPCTHNYACMKAITPETVLHTLQRLLVQTAQAD